MSNYRGDQALLESALARAHVNCHQAAAILRRRGEDDEAYELECIQRHLQSLLEAQLRPKRSRR